MDEKIKKTLDEASEVYLWLTIEGLGGFVWRMNHDLADGRIESTPGIEKDLITMQEQIEYAVSQLERFGIKNPKGEDKEVRDAYWEWYQTWKKHIEALPDPEYKELNDMLQEDHTDSCDKFCPPEILEKRKPQEELIEDGLMEDTFFGKRVRELRLDKKIGLRKMAEKMEMKPSEYCDIEHGYAKPPEDDMFLQRLITTLELQARSEQWLELMRLYKLPFVMQKMPTGGVPLFPIASDGRKLTTEDHVKLHEYLQNYFEEHNKKADAYNREHGVF